MKVLKFGGSSVGSVIGIKNLKEIAQGCDKPVVVVVSALGGVTDMLISTAVTAAAGDETFREGMAGLTLRHHNIIDEVITDDPASLKGQRRHTARRAGLDISRTLPHTRPQPQDTGPHRELRRGV